MDTIKRILLVGGTHGNELTGVYLIQKWQAGLNPLRRCVPSGHLDLLLANPLAISQCRRYATYDLNRCFAQSMLSLKESPAMSQEIQRAQEINREFVPKGPDTLTDLIIDIHNTTAHMGITLILSARDPITMRIAAELAQEFPEVHLFLQPEERSESPYLGTIARRDICVEVGPQVHGTLNATLFEATERLVVRLLELVELSNQQKLGEPCHSVPVYQERRLVDFPRNAEGHIVAMIHPQLLGQDYQELKPGMPMFRTFSGNDLPWTGSESVWPVFINEAAYYEKRIAMTLTSKTQEVW